MGKQDLPLSIQRMSCILCREYKRFCEWPRGDKRERKISNPFIFEGCSSTLIPTTLKVHRWLNFFGISESKICTLHSRDQDLGLLSLEITLYRAQLQEKAFYGVSL